MSRKKLRRVTLVLVGVLLPAGAFGFGYFYSNKNIDNKVAQTLTVDGYIGGTVVSNVDNIDNIVPGDTINKSINILPNATTPSLLRVKIEPNWYNREKGTELSVENIELLYNNVTESFVDYDGKEDYWFKSEDGYLYYINSVTTKDKAIELVKGIKFNGGSNDANANQYQGKHLKIKVTMEMIQCKYAPYKKRWNIDTKSDLYSKLKNLCSNADEIVE